MVARATFCSGAVRDGLAINSDDLRPSQIHEDARDQGRTNNRPARSCNCYVRLAAVCQTGVMDRVLHPVEPLAIRLTLAVQL